VKYVQLDRAGSGSLGGVGDKFRDKVALLLSRGAEARMSSAQPGDVVGADEIEHGEVRVENVSDLHSVTSKLNIIPSLEELAHG
jgi:hypothetical protein